MTAGFNAEAQRRRGFAETDGKDTFFSPRLCASAFPLPLHTRVG